MLAPTPASPPAPAPLRLLQVVGGAADPAAGVTGVERVAQTLVGGLDASYGFVHFVAYPVSGALYDWFHTRVQGELTVFPQRRLDAAWVRTLEEFLHAHAIDVVLSHGMRYDFLCALACRRSRIPHVIARAAPLAGEAMPRWRKLVYGVVDTWSLHACKGIVTVSEASRRRMQATQGLRRRRITVIPNAVTVTEVDTAARAAARRDLGIEPTDFVVGSAGRLVPGKCFARLVGAAGRLRPRPDRPLIVVLLGDGPERGALAAQARAAGVTLLLPGYVAAPQAMLGSFDVVVLPSRAEGMPLVVLEAMALGVPTLATAVGGIPEVIVDRESGLLVPVEDEVALTRALQELVDSAALRQSLGTAGARRVREHFHVDAMLAGYAAALWCLSGRKADAAPAATWRAS